MLTNNIFTQAAQNWELERLAQAIINIKIQENTPPELAHIEKVILCGLLCGYHPETLAQQLPSPAPNLTVTIVQKTYTYLQKIAAQQLNPDIIRKNDIVTLLSWAGYKKSPEQSLKNVSEGYPLSLQDETIVLRSPSQQQKIPANQLNDAAILKIVTPSQEKPQTITLQSKQITKYKSNNNSNLVKKTTQNPQLNHALAKSYPSSTIDTRLFPAINRWTTIGGLVTMGLVGIGFILAATIKYDVTVKANATVRPEGEIKLVQTSKDGRIKSIEVKENQAVKRGQVIAYLDDSELQNKTQQLSTNVKHSQDKLTQIEAQITALETQIIAETNKSDRTIDSAEAELQNTQTEYQQKQITTQAKVDEAKAQLNIAQQELAKAETELQSLEANLKSTEASLTAAQSKRDRYQQILTSGAISQEQFEEAQLAVQQQEQTLASQKATLLGQKQTIEAQKQSVAVAQAQLAQAQVTVNSDDAVVEIAQQAIEREKATKSATNASFMREKEALIQQKIDIEKQITEEKQQLQQLEQEIEQSVLKATADGKILKLELRNQNQVVNPQDTIAQIAPDATQLVIKAQINPQDRDRVEVGQLAKLKIDACPYPDYGILSGKVTAISADTITSQDNEQQYYTAELTPATETLAQGDRICPLRSGMLASADIITKAETPLQFFLRRARLITDW